MLTLQTRDFETALSTLNFCLKATGYEETKDFKTAWNRYPSKKFYFIETPTHANKAIILIVGQLSIATQLGNEMVTKYNLKSEVPTTVAGKPTKISFWIEDLNRVGKYLETKANNSIVGTNGSEANIQDTNLVVVNQKLTVELPVKDLLVVESLKEFLKKKGMPVHNVRYLSAKNSRSEGVRHFTFADSVQAVKALGILQKEYPAIDFKHDHGKKNIIISDTFFQKRRKTNDSHLKTDVSEYSGDQELLQKAIGFIQTIEEGCRTSMEEKNFFFSKKFRQFEIPFTAINNEIKISEGGKMIIPIEYALKYIK